MLEEVISYLVKKQDKYFLDCTVGEGGHSEEILTRFSGIVIYGLDRDPEILEIARNRLSVFRERFCGININFRDVSLLNINLGGELFDSVLIDLGISFFHYKKSKKGFSFSKKEKLDMRLDDTSLNAYDIVNTHSEANLADVFFRFGDERFSRRIAKKIVYEREKKPIEYSDQLAEIIANAIPTKFHPKRIHPATKCFQALRIASNNELENIQIGIPKVFSLLKKGGRLGVITFHSGEDRIVKKIFANLYKDCICPLDVPICTCSKKREINWVARAVKPSNEEVEKNPASRSAKLRVVEKI